MRPFEEIVQEHGSVVMRVCRAVLASADAEDAWSETFLAAMRAYPRLRPDSNVRGWLVTIAHRKAIDQRRSQMRRAAPSGELPDIPTADAPSTDGLAREALGALAPKQRLAVIYHYLADLPYAEVGALMGTTEEAARRSAADGITNLRRRYTEGAPHDGD